MIFFLHKTEQLGVVAFVLYHGNRPRTAFSEIVEALLVGIKKLFDPFLALSSALQDMEVSEKELQAIERRACTFFVVVGMRVKKARAISVR